MLEPPLARVDDQFQLLVGVGQLPFVDDQPGIDASPLVLSGRHGVENAVEGDDHVIEIGAQTEPQGEIGRGAQPRHGNRGPGQLIERHGPPGHDHRTVAVAHARAARTEDVAIAQVGVGMNAQGRQLQLAFEGPAVERLDVDQLVR